MGYTKSHSSYTIKKKHQEVEDGTIFERDISTVGGIVERFNGESITYNSGNFVLTNSKSFTPSVSLPSDRWKTNDEEGSEWNLTIAEEMLEVDTDKTLPKNKFVKHDCYDISSFAYYGSSSELVRTSIEEIIREYPGELFVLDGTDHSNWQIYSYERPDGSIASGTYGEGDYVNPISNPFLVDIVTDNEMEEKTIGKFLNGGFLQYELIDGNGTVHEIDGWESDTRYWFKNGIAVRYGSESYHRYTWGEIVNMGLNKTCFLPGDECGFVTINADDITLDVVAYMGNDMKTYVLYTTSDFVGYHIRPKETYWYRFFNSISPFSQCLMSEVSDEGYESMLYAYRETEEGYEKIRKVFLFPFGAGGYNVATSGTEYNSFLYGILGECKTYDSFLCDNIYRRMLHDPIKDFDWSVAEFSDDAEAGDLLADGMKITRSCRVYGRFFDEIRHDINSIVMKNNISYGRDCNASEEYIEETLENDGWDVVPVYTKTLHEFFENENGIVYERRVNPNNPYYFDQDYIAGGMVSRICTTNEEENWVMTMEEDKYHLNREFSDDTDFSYIPYSRSYLGPHENGYYKDRCCNIIEGNGMFHYQEEEYITYMGYRLYLCNGTVKINGVTYTEVDDTVTIDGVSYPVMTETGMYRRQRGYRSDDEYSANEIDNELIKRMKLCSGYLLRKKGTQTGVKDLLGVLGMMDKDFYNSLPETSKAMYDGPDYQIDEYTCFTNVIRDEYDNRFRRCEIDRWNSYKNIKFDDSQEYDGLFVKGYRVYKDGPRYTFNRYSEDGDILPRVFNYVFPYYDKNKEYDGNGYYQMNGGWQDTFPYRFTMKNDIILPQEYNGATEGVYKKTWRHILGAKNINDMLSFSVTNLHEGIVCKVNDLSTPYMIVNGKPFRIYGESVMSGDTVVKCSYIKVNSNGYGVTIGNLTFVDDIVVSNIDGRCDEECGEHISPEYMKLMRKRYEFNGRPTTIKVYLYVIEQTEGSVNPGGSNEPVREEEPQRSINGYVKKPFFYEEGMDLTGIHPTVDVYNTNFQCVDSYLYVFDEERDSMYFKLEDVTRSSFFGEFGWNPVPKGDFVELENEDIETLIEGNNPHDDRNGYDTGKNYINRIAKLFSHTIETSNVNVSSELSMQDYIEHVSGYGFTNLVENEYGKDYIMYPDSKIHCFADMHMTNGWNRRDTGNVMAYSEWIEGKDNDLAETTKYACDYEMKNVDRIHDAYSEELESAYYLPNGRATPPPTAGIESCASSVIGFSGNCTDKIINTKVVRVTFFVPGEKAGETMTRGQMERVKFIDSCIIPWMTQMIPSTSILQIQYDFSVRE